MFLLFRGVLLLAVCLGLSGCFPSSETNLDEQKDPYFLNGKRRVTDRDYKGAIESFEKALEVNPRSASAHFELGVLYDQYEHDYAAALYHYDRAVKIRPNEHPAGIAQERINICKRELAKSVSHTPQMEVMQRELDRVTEENKMLRQRLDSWQSYYATRGASGTPTGHATNPAQAPTSAPPRMTTSTRPTPPAPAPTPPRRTEPLFPAGPNVSSTGRVTPLPAAQRSHTIARGETLMSLSRRYGVSLHSLLSANPSVNPRKLHVGQRIKIPSA